MIKTVTIKWTEHSNETTYNFNKDLNVLTGSNGSGKTTLMKLIWYTVSQKFTNLLREIPFHSINILKYDGSNCRIQIDYPHENSIDNDKYDDSLSSIRVKKTQTLSISIFNKQVEETFHGTFSPDELEEFMRKREENFLFSDMDIFKTSLFFPTFRRIEGGFDSNIINRFSRSSLRDSLYEFSENLSRENHKFITSISTDDIDTLISKKYAEISFKNRKLEEVQNKQILKLINNIDQASVTDDNKTSQTFQKIKSIIEKYESIRNTNLNSFEILDSFTSKVFNNKSIKINKIILGKKNKSIIKSDSLSSGEKQMLGFMCYNFFYDHATIFIDEPELSLHVDWQRILFDILLKQQENNQFIIATHSPFIYTKFPDKEIILQSRNFLE